MNMRKLIWIAAVLAVIVVVGVSQRETSAQVAVPLPVADPGPDQHIFYGATPPFDPQAPVIVFLHGLRGRAADWWENNDMYQFAYRAGYRTAYVSMSRDNTPNDLSIAENANVIEDALPKIAVRYGVNKLFVVAHSKGGLDLQEAVAREQISSLVRAVFTISTPNTGTELADWGFGPGRPIAELLGLVTPGVSDQRTAFVADFRRRVDPILTRLQIPFYTMWGTTSAGNPLLRITGLILANVTPVRTKNDGLVPEHRTTLPLDFATDVGPVPDNHFLTDSGVRVFPRINSYLQQYRTDSPDFKKIVSNGFGDPANTWIWSQAWFKGKLYAGTAQSQHCLTFATAAVRLDGPTQDLAYPPIGGDFGCTEDMRDLPLSGEIWQYTPETKKWVRVYKSPNVVPVKFSAGGDATGFTGLDVGFRDMIVYREKDGTEALYVAGIGASSTFDVLDYYKTHPYPSPRILRSVDGINFVPLRADAGTFLGDLVGNSPEEFRIRGFRSFAALKGKLFVTASDYRGVGLIIVSEDPQDGNNAWAYAGPTAAEMPVWTLATFNDHLYAVTGDRRFDTGYEVYKAVVDGLPPYFFQRIVSGAAGQTGQKLKALNGLSFGVFRDRLYVGTDRQTEMIRVNADDTWDLVSGYPRETEAGLKTPITGISQWFGNYFNGHFWRMANWNQRLYVGTWDWSILLRPVLILDSLFSGQYGTDVYSTDDGVEWRFETRQGFGNPTNFGTRSWGVTPYGLYVGTAKPSGGADIFANQSILDFDGDGDIDSADVQILQQDAAANLPASGPDDARDIDRDGFVTTQDVERLRTQCGKPKCALTTPLQPPVPAPAHLAAASAYVVGPNTVALTWHPVPGAARYIVFRSDNKPVVQLFPKDLTITLPEVGEVHIPGDFTSGRFDELCEEEANSASLLCILNNLFQGVDVTTPWLGLPLPFVSVAATTATSYTEAPPSSLQSVYYVIAIDSRGRRSRPSNFVGGPSYALPTTLATAGDALRRLQRQGADAGLVASARTRVEQVTVGLRQTGVPGSRAELESEIARLDRWVDAHPEKKGAAVDVRRVLTEVVDTLQFVQTGRYAPSALWRNEKELAAALPVTKLPLARRTEVVATH
jgi:pimeloyl-ACP methyl ester carboxylesterase